MQNKTPKWKKSVNQPQTKNISEDLLLYEWYSHVGTVIEIRCDDASWPYSRVLWDSGWISDIEKKKLKKSQNEKKKKRKGEQSVVYGIELNRKMFGCCDMIYNITCSDTDAWSNVVVFLSLDKPENVKLMVNGSVVCKGDVIGITCSAAGKPALWTVWEWHIS